MKHIKPVLKETSLKILHPGDSFSLSAPAELVLENGGTHFINGRLPNDMPIGYHTLRFLNTGKLTCLINAPRSCFVPNERQGWGWALQLYSLRTKKSCGMGDLADLRRFARWSRKQLATDFLLINPLGAPKPVSPQQSSPYYPSSRLYRNPLYLRVEEIGRLPFRARQTLANAAHALNGNPLIERDKIFRFKMPLLRSLWQAFPGHQDFDAYVQTQGQSLELFAAYCALKEKHENFPALPNRFSHPGKSATLTFALENKNEIRFHKWLQWNLDVQFARCAAEIPIFQDLPIGFDPTGADAWIWQDLLARNFSIGAPPDNFNTQGQNWGLIPFIPEKLRAAHYEPFCHTVRAALAHSRGLRIDHVMGLFRLFWIPQGESPKNGQYVRYPAEELLAILAIESHRAKAFIIGEDLGTVESGVRSTLRRHKVFSYRVLWFQPGLRPKAPQQSLGAVTTHDLPTIAGLWTGSDIETQTKLGLQPNIAATLRLIRRLKKILKIKSKVPVREVILRLHRHFAKTDSQLIVATVEDALAVQKRPNLPGTVLEHPNWVQALPQTLEAIQKNPIFRELAKIMSRSAFSSAKKSKSRSAARTRK